MKASRETISRLSMLVYNHSKRFLYNSAKTFFQFYISYIARISGANRKISFKFHLFVFEKLVRVSFLSSKANRFFKNLSASPTNKIIILNSVFSIPRTIRFLPLIQTILAPENEFLENQKITHLIHNFLETGFKEISWTANRRISETLFKNRIAANIKKNKLSPSNFVKFDEDKIKPVSPIYFSALSETGFNLNKRTLSRVFYLISDQSIPAPSINFLLSEGKVLNTSSTAVDLGSLSPDGSKNPIDINKLRIHFIVEDNDNWNDVETESIKMVTEEGLRAVVIPEKVSIHEGIYASWAIDHFYNYKIKGQIKENSSVDVDLNHQVTILAVYTSAISIYTSLAVILAKMGYAITLLLHPKATKDGSVPDPVNQTLIDNEVKKLSKTLVNFGVKVDCLNRFDDNAILSHHIINDIEKQSIADVKTMLMDADLKIKDTKVRKLLDFRKTENQNFAQKLISYLKSHQSDNYIIDSGSWAEYGIAYSVLKEKKEQTTCMAFRNQKGFVVIGKNSPFTELNVEQEWDRIKNINLNHEQKEKVKLLFDDFSGKAFYESEAYFKFQTETKLTIENIKDIYLKDKNRPTLLILPNVAWDTTLLIDKPNLIFESHTDWFIKLLNYFKDREDVNILIRPHPAEKIFKNKNNVQDLYHSILGNELEHITMIDVSSSVNTYGLIDAADLIFTYTSDIGWEAVLQGRTVVSGGCGPSWGKGITHDSKTEKEFFANIEKFIMKNNSQTEILKRRRKAEKFLLLYLSEIPLPFPFENGNFWSETGVKILKEILTADETEFDNTFRLLANKQVHKEGFVCLLTTESDN